jgi:hypothetical protein
MPIQGSITQYLRGVMPDELEHAAEFYSKSPTGQYDEIAEACIRFILANDDVLWP